jgi:S-DNA-T family DNA segregation ATPase FtsK/SpoIIIE
MVDKQIEQFYKENKIDLKVIKKVESLQLTTFFSKIDCYDVRIINRILKLQSALCLYLQVDNINIRQDNTSGCIVFEIPKKDRKILSYGDLQKDYVKDNNGLYVNLGVDTQNNTYNLDLCKTPHLLISGTTGSGKSVLVNSILTSLLMNYSPKELELVLIDVKQVEFSIYKNIPHLLCDTVTDLKDTKVVLSECIENINSRYNILKNNNCRNIQEYNRINQDKMKYRLIVIDELAELFMLEGKSKLRADIEGYDRIENQLCRIAQIGRACGVHLILATQRPSTDVITGLLKSNIPSRIALSVSSAVDSKVVLDSTGAEKLTGKGDMLLKLIGNNNLIRLQSAFISDEQQIEYINVIKYIYKNYSNDITHILDKKNSILEESKINEKKVESIIEQNIRYFIEHDNIYSYDVKKKIIYNFSNKDLFINRMAFNESEKKYARNIYIKIANKVFSEYDKVYKARNNTYKAPQTTYRKTTKRSKITGLGITYCVGSGIYGFLKGLTKGR